MNGARTCLFWLAALHLVLSLPGLVACGKKKDDKPGAVPAPQAPADPNAVSDAAFYVEPVLESKFDYYFHQQSSFSSSCRVTPGETDTNKSDIYCMLDAAELDLFIRPIGLRVNTPKTMCKYMAVTLYYYFAFEPAPAGYVLPIEVNLNADGTLNTTNPAGIYDKDGNIKCQYDYTAAGGPNCCEGIAAVTTNKTGGGSTYTELALGGLRANCLAGPAMDVLEKGLNGWPIREWSWTDGIGLNKTYNIQSPIDKKYGSDIYVANYFDPAVFGAAGSTFPPPLTTNMPTAVRSTNPYYEFSCMDEAQEFRARIRVLVRAWDTVANFTAKTNPYTDPDPNEAHFDTPLHDRSVWNDIAVGDYPGYD